MSARLQFPGSLHNHTDFSNLRLRDCIIKLEELIDYAIELGHEVVAVTDHDSVSNAIKVEKYYNKVKEKNPNFKVILGNEIYLCRNGLNGQNFKPKKDKYYHFVLLAKDAIGHKQIREISSRAWERSYMARGMRRVPTYYQDLVDIIGANPGHVVGSTACLGGLVPTQLLNWRETGDETIVPRIEIWIEQMKEIFGEGNFFLEMQPSNNVEQVFVNKALVALSKRTKTPYIITTDSHYLKKSDRKVHKAYLRAQSGEREVDAFYATTYLMETEELESFFEYLDEEQLDEAYRNILAIKNMCSDYTLLKDLEIPELFWKTPKKLEPDSQRMKDQLIKEMPEVEKMYKSSYEGNRRLVDLVLERVIQDKTLQDKRTLEEINDNFRIIRISSEVNKVNWSAYFLNLQNIVDICWEANSLVGPGRGSGVGFLLLYILGITQINPLRENTETFSWRFLNPERVSVLDVDIDSESSRREDILNAFREYYGADRVANVITFGTEKAKSAIQTAARGLGIDVDTAQYLSSLVPSDRGMVRTLSQCMYGDEENGWAPVSQFVHEMTNNFPELWEVASKIEGLVCRMGTHAGGVIFVDKPFTESTSLMRAPDGTLITAFDLHDCQDAGLIKYDILAVNALDKMHNTIDLLCDYGYAERKPTLKETYEDIIGIYNLEREDEKMWEMIWNHEVTSLFQMEQQSGVQGIALTKPRSVDELAVLNSVIRLMPQEKGAELPLNKFARFKNNIDLWYQEMREHGLTQKEMELLEPILKISFGICESQEKFMQLVQLPELGGFSIGWADKLRKAVAKKEPAAFEALTEEFFERIKEKGLSINLAKYVWNVLIATSRGYGFNASHTLAYSLIALQQMNLAFRYPIIFWNTGCLISESGR